MEKVSEKTMKTIGDEPGFIMFRTEGQRQKPLHYASLQSAFRNNEGVTRFEEVADSYTPAPNDPLLEEALIEVLPAFVGLVQSFGLKAPVIVLANLRDKGHVARFVDGTESDSPVFLLDPEPTLNLTGYQLQEFVVQSLKHELGHAYLRTLGVEYEEEGEEGVVEEFALTGERPLLEAWAYARSCDSPHMKGLTAISTGICPGCQECADTHADGDVEKLQRLWETGRLADEASFSWSACECCGSHLGGDRTVAHAVDSKNETIHMDGFCMDCVFYIA